MHRVKVKEYEVRRVLLKLLTFVVVNSTVMENVLHEEEQSKETDKGNVQIVYMNREVGEDNPEATHINTLIVVLK